MRIPVHVRLFPGSNEERLDLLAAILRHCLCKALEGDRASVAVIEDPCPSHDLLGQEATLKQLVFQRRWYRERGIA